MSLNPAQRAATASELAANLALAGLTPEALAQRAGLPLARTRAALAVTGGDPADVWVLRDVLETAVLEAGARPVPYTVLTDDKRAAAGGW